MSNPFQQHRSALFAERDSIDAALHYVHEIISTFEGADRAAALTAIMVLVNTSAKLWPEAPAQVDTPEAPAPLDVTVTDRLLQLIRSEINAWAEDNFDRHADEWLDHHADLDEKIETWVENNLDIEDEIKDVLREATVNISV